MLGEDYTLQASEDIRGRMSARVALLMHDRLRLVGPTACAELERSAVVKPASRACRASSFNQM